MRVGKQTQCHKDGIKLAHAPGHVQHVMTNKYVAAGSAVMPGF